MVRDAAQTRTLPASKGQNLAHRIRLSAAIALLVSTPGLATQQQGGVGTLAPLVQRVGKAVVSLRVYDPEGRLIAAGSGFIAADGRVVTNSHVVQRAGRVEVVSSNGQLLLTTSFAEALSTDFDLAILSRIPDPPSTVPLAQDTASVGDHIVVFGAPEGLTNSVSDGIVSAYRQLSGRRLMQLTAPVSSGSSGGPVISLDGRVVGITVARLVEGQNLNFAIPAGDAVALLNSPPGHYQFPGAAPGDVPPARTGTNKVFAIIAANDTQRDLQVSVDLRRALNDSGIMTQKASGRWGSAREALKDICTERLIDGLLIVGSRGFQVFSCGSQPTIDIAPGAGGLKEMVDQLIQRLRTL